MVAVLSNRVKFIELDMTEMKFDALNDDTILMFRMIAVDIFFILTHIFVLLIYYT